jgi:hypothetical protein
MRSWIFALLLAPSLAFAQQLDFDKPVTQLVSVESPPVLWVQLSTVTQPVEIAAKNAVMLDFPVGNGTGHRGSGVYLGDRYVATAHHVPEGAQQRGTVTFRDGTKIGCIVNGRDSVWDQCIVTLDKEHPTLPGVEIAESDPQVGQEIYSVGFGQGFRIFGGAVTGYAGNNLAPGQDWFNHRNPAVSGDSGGPMFNQSGELVGCLWGTGSGQTIGTKTSRFRVFVKPLFPRLAQWRANRIGRQIAGIQPLGSCPPGGQCPPQQQPPYQGGGGYQEPTLPISPITPDPPMQLQGPQGPMGPAGPQGVAGPEGPMGPKGDKGDKGDDGEAGVAGEVSEAHLQAIITAVVANLKADPAMRGPQGPTGQAGPTGPTGPAGKDGEGITPAQIAKLKAELLAEMKANIPDTRVLLVGGGKIIDDETYKPGEPIVLNMTQLIRAANPR